MKDKETVVLIDGKMMAYRSHFSHRSLRTQAGESTGMIHGFLWELLRINKKLPQAKIVICWDGKPPTWRHTCYPAYKANRPFNPDFKVMKQEQDWLLDILRDLGLQVAILDGVEADDMIGILSTDLVCRGYQVRIYSSDRDMYQLVNEWVSIWSSYKEQPMKRKGIEAWLGLPFEALMDIRIAAGDPGDNLKGFPGVGYKTAIKLWKTGFRIRDIKTWPKCKEDWKRIRSEDLLARIITDTDHNIWSARIRDELKELSDEIIENPGQNRQKAYDNRNAIYKTLGYFELEELLAERHKFFRFP